MDLYHLFLEPMEKVSFESIARDTFLTLFKPILPKTTLNKYQHFAHVLLGYLFVRRYRIFIKRDDLQVLIFFKLHEKRTNYLYLKICKTQTEAPSNQDKQALLEAVDSIDKMKGEQQKDFTIFLWFFKEGCASELNKKKFENWVKNPIRISANFFWADPMEQRPENSQNVLEDLSLAKKILQLYVDTFGERHITQTYIEFQKRAATSFSLPKLINTINWIISIQLNGSPYNQIETSNYSAINIFSKKCVIDRKDLVFTGSGRILMIEILLLPRCENPYDFLHVNAQRCSSEINQLMKECHKTYSHGKMKVMVVTDKLKHDLIYSVKGLTVAEFQPKELPSSSLKQ